MKKLLLNTLLVLAPMLPTLSNAQGNHGKPTKELISKTSEVRQTRSVTVSIPAWELNGFVLPSLDNTSNQQEVLQTGSWLQHNPPNDYTRNSVKNSVMPVIMEKCLGVADGRLVMNLEYIGFFNRNEYGLGIAVALCTYSCR